MSLATTDSSALDGKPAKTDTRAPGARVEVYGVKASVRPMAMMSTSTPPLLHSAISAAVVSPGASTRSAPEAAATAQRPAPDDEQGLGLAGADQLLRVVRTGGGLHDRGLRGRHPRKRDEVAHGA